MGETPFIFYYCIACFKRHTMEAYQGNTAGMVCPLNVLWQYGKVRILQYSYRQV